MPEVEALAADPRVYKVSGPMCRFAMRATGDDGVEGYVRKDTTFLTSSLELAKVLQGVCSNERGKDLHRHVHLIGGGQATAAAEYPVKMVRAVLRGMRRQLERDGKWSPMNAFDAGPVPEDDERTWMARQEEAYGLYWDDVNGGYLPAKEVEQARKEELNWMVKKDVFEKVPRSEFSGKLLTMKWVDTRKTSGLVRV